MTATASLRVGARAVTERDGRVATVSEAAAALGVPVQPGDAFAACAALLGQRMAALIIAALTNAAHVPEALWAAAPSGSLDVPRVLFSGGVGEYLRGEKRGFGDLGQALGANLAARIATLALERVAARECLLATALGAAAFSVQRSGAATHISEPAALLPRRDLRVLRPHLPAGADAAALAAAIQAHLAANGADPRVPLALALAAAAEAEPLAEALAASCAEASALYLFTEGEAGAALGAALAARLPAMPLMVVDGIALWDLDFVDCGRLRLPSGAVPITVKSLVFGDDPRTAQPPRR